MKSYKSCYQQLYYLDVFIIKPINLEFITTYKKSLHRLEVHRFNLNEIASCELNMLKGILSNFYKNEFITAATYLEYLNCIAFIENIKN